MSQAAQVIEASKTYGGVCALARVDFSIDAGEVRALLGKNGAGKSTLIRMLSGAETADEGRVLIGGRDLDRGSVAEAQRLGVRTVYQELSLIPQLSIAENMFMGDWPKRAGRIDRRHMLDETWQALARLNLGLDPRVLVGDISIADRQLVEIARALAREPRVLILDEPTSSLAAAEVDRVLDAVTAIRQSGVAVIYVSHRVGEIRRIADSATIMRNGEVVDTFAIQDRTTREMVDMMLGEAGGEAERVTEPLPAGASVVEIRDLVVKPKLTGISFDIRENEVLGIAGVLGSGRTELLQVIAGLRTPDAGMVSIDGNRSSGRGHRFALRRGVGLTPEDRKTDGIIPDLGLDENLVLSDLGKVSRFGVLSTSGVRRAARDAMAAMSIKSASARTPIGALSGGNQQKVVIGRWLHAGSSVLLLDEPTRGVDVMAKQQIYALLRDLAAAGRAVVFVSSEMEELNLVCDRVIVLNNGRIIAEHLAPDIETEHLLLAAIAETD